MPARTTPPVTPFNNPVKNPGIPFSFDPIIGPATIDAAPDITPLDIDFNPEESPEKKCFGLRVENKESSVPIKLNS